MILFCIKGFIFSAFLISLHPSNVDGKDCIEMNIGYDGYDLANPTTGQGNTYFTGIETTLKCQEKCFENKDCSYFLYVSNDFPSEGERKKCYLKTSDAGSKPWPGIHSGAASCPCIEMNIGYDKYDLSNPTTGQGNTYFTGIESILKCQEKCSENEECSYFLYVSDSFVSEQERRKCYLKTSNEGRTVWQGIHSGAASCESSCHEKDTGYKGYDMENPNGQKNFYFTGIESSKNCMYKCQENEGCTHFFYVSDDFTSAQERRKCYLKTSDAGSVEWKGMISGPVSCASDCHVMNMGFDGNDLPNPNGEKNFYFTGIESSLKCSEKCQENKGCTNFVYVSDDFSRAQERRKCYLKTSDAGSEEWAGMITGPAYC